MLERYNAPGHSRSAAADLRSEPYVEGANSSRIVPRRIRRAKAVATRLDKSEALEKIDRLRALQNVSTAAKTEPETGITGEASSTEPPAGAIEHLSGAAPQKEKQEATTTDIATKDIREIQQDADRKIGSRRCACRKRTNPRHPTGWGRAFPSITPGAANPNRPPGHRRQRKCVRGGRPMPLGVVRPSRAPETPICSEVRWRPQSCHLYYRISGARLVPKLTTTWSQSRLYRRSTAFFQCSPSKMNTPPSTSYPVTQPRRSDSGEQANKIERKTSGQDARPLAERTILSAGNPKSGGRGQQT